MSRSKIFWLLFVFSWFLPACGTPSPTLAPLPVHTPSPTPTLRPPIISSLNLDRLKLLKQFGRGAIAGIALSPDGKTLVVASYTGVYVYDAETLDEKRVLNTRSFVVFTPTGDLIVGYHVFEVWDVNTGQQVRAFGSQVCCINRFALSPTGEFLAIVERRGYLSRLRIWDVNTEREILTLDIDFYKVVLAFKPDGHTLAFNTGVSIRLLNLITHKFDQDINLAEPIETMFFSSDSRTLIFEDSGPVELLDLETGQFQRFKQEPTGIAMALSPDGLNLAVISFDGSIQIWNLTTGENWQTFESELNANQVIFSPDGEKVLINSLETMEIWEVETGKILGKLFYPVAIGQVSFYQAGEQHWVVSDGRSLFPTPLNVWDITTQQWVRLPMRLSTGILSPDWRWFAVPGECGSVEIWEPMKGQLVRKLEMPCSGIPLAFSPDSLTLALGERETIQLWDVATGHLRWTLTNPGNYRVAFSPDNQTIAIGSDNNGIQLWDTTNGQLLRILPIVRVEEEASADNSNVVLMFSPDGSKLASVEYRAIRVWDLTTHQRLYSLKINIPTEEGSSNVDGIAFSPDGRLLVTDAGDNTHFAIRDANTGQVLRSIKHFGNSSYRVAFSPDGRWLALLGGGIIRLWGVE